MTPRPLNDCAHERRPGTTVCLYCRAEERAVARQRRQRQLARLGAYGGVAAVLVAAALAAFSTFGGGTTNDETTVATAEARETPTEFAAQQAGTARPAARTVAAASAPVVPPGRTALAGGMFAERSGDTVTVNFDTRGARTRRSDKFEHVVRETLPLILGEPARLALDRIPQGSLVAPGQLVESVGSAPLRLPVGDGRVVTLAPGSRMGQDGPLVVTYRAIVDAEVQSPTS